MLKDVTNIVGSAMPNASLICYAAGIFAGRKFCMAFTCKVGSVVGNILGIQEMSEPCNNLSTHYWTEAKKDGFRDILAVVGLIALGFAANRSGESLIDGSEKQNKPYFSRPKESSKTEYAPQDSYWHYPKIILDTFIEYPKTALTAFSAPILGISWKYRNILCHRGKEKLLDYEFFLNQKFTTVRDRSITNPFSPPISYPEIKMHVYKFLGKGLGCIINHIQENRDQPNWSNEPQPTIDLQSTIDFYDSVV